MKLLALLLVLATPLVAQGPPPELSAKAARQLVADWKARDVNHAFACLFVHWEDSVTVSIDSAAPAGPAAAMFCDKAGGIAKFVDEKPNEQMAFSDMMAARVQHPAWSLATEIYATLKGQFGELTEVPLGVTLIWVRKPGTT